MLREFEFEDGAAYDFKTRAGIITFVCDTKASPPIRLYGPDGMQIDARDIRLYEAGSTYGGYIAFDLRSLEGGKG